MKIQSIYEAGDPCDKVASLAVFDQEILFLFFFRDLSHTLACHTVCFFDRSPKQNVNSFMTPFSGSVF